VAEKYWHISSGKWNFAVNERWALIKRSSVPIQEHVKVQGQRSPFDGDWIYWATRMGKHPDLPKREAELLKRQKGKCAYCGLYFKDEDVLEVDHIIPKALGGRNERKNWQLLHQHCHDKKTAKDGSLTGRGTRDKSQIIEEPCEAKVSRTDLKTNQKGQPHG
jgi:RNA-directed DNA polymerase